LNVGEKHQPDDERKFIALDVKLEKKKKKKKERKNKIK